MTGGKKQKKYIYQLRRTYQDSQEIAKDWLRRVKIYKIGNFNLIDKENLILRKKVQLYV